MAGIMLKQESGGRVQWQRQSGMMRRHVSTMMPIDFWIDCLRWTNDSLPDNVAAFSEHKHWMCLDVLYAKNTASNGKNQGPLAN